MYALGGSTNAVLHLLAIAREAEVPLAIGDFNRVAAKIPLLGNFKPFGEYVMAHLHEVGAMLCQCLSSTTNGVCVRWAVCPRV